MAGCYIKERSIKIDLEIKEVVANIYYIYDKKIW